MSLGTLGWIVGVVIVLVGVWTIGSVAVIWDIEEAAYDRIEARAGYEVRRYAPRVVAETAMPRYDRDSSSAGFRAVAGYIFGGNDRAEKIAMTTPVIMAPAAGLDADAAATGPTSGRSGMSFVLPGAYPSVEALPKPRNAGVVLRAEPERLVAALRFGWYATPGRVAAFSRQLTQSLARDGRLTIGRPYLASYNPPFSSPLIMRHDILVDLAPR